MEDNDITTSTISQSEEQEIGMNISDHMQQFFNDLSPILQMADDEIASYRTEIFAGEAQRVPDLVSILANHFGWDKKETYANDPIIRQYLRKHPKWGVGKGAKGGIIPRSEINAKEEREMTKFNAKNEAKAMLEKKLQTKL